MQTDLRHALPARLLSLAAMAALLERLESNPPVARAGQAGTGKASAEQYRLVAMRTSALLAETPTDSHLHALLAASPATAQLYENLRYQHAGLCMAPLEEALNAELAAGAAIERARRSISA